MNKTPEQKARDNIDRMLERVPAGQLLTRMQSTGPLVRRLRFGNIRPMWVLPTMSWPIRLSGKKAASRSPMARGNSKRKSWDTTARISGPPPRTNSSILFSTSAPCSKPRARRQWSFRTTCCLKAGLAVISQLRLFMFYQRACNAEILNRRFNAKQCLTGQRIWFFDIKTQKNKRLRTKKGYRHPVCPEVTGLMIPK